MVSAPGPERRALRWARLLFGTTERGPAVDVALLVVRLALAWIFIDYGAAKLFGVFPGSGPHGLHQTSLYMSQAAHLRPGGLFAVMAALIELGGGIAMALGLCTRLAGLALFGDMVMAIVTVTGATGFNPTGGGTGYQLNLPIAALALAAALIGGGRFSIDALIYPTTGWRRMVRSRAGSTRRGSDR